MPGKTSKQEYDSGQLAAGWRSMSLLATLIHRGGRPAAVAPTIGLLPGERQYGWFPVDSDRGRELAVITNQRLIVGAAEHPLARMTAQPSVGFISPLAWSALQACWILSALGSASTSPLALVSVESMMVARLRSAWARASGAETACVMILV